MDKESQENRFMKLLKGIQEYWFLITLLFSALAAIFYFIYFDVNPLEKQYENKMQKLHVELHNSIGFSHLQQGYYKKAMEEFSNALEYKSFNREALNGKLLSELFLSLNSLEHNPTLVEKTKVEVAKLEIDKNDELYNVREKYYADLELRSGKNDEAIDLYDQLLTEDSSYVDLLNTYAWLTYERGDPEHNKMEVLFKKMTEVAPNDYRGFHGYAYSLYMHAIQEQDPSIRNDIMYLAANKCIDAYNLIITRFNVVLDLGEIVRSINPDMALDIHLRAKQLLEDPAIMELEENSPPLGYKLMLVGENYIIMATLEQKRALVFYEMALDYLADYRLNYEITSLVEHDEMLQLASDLDKNGDIRLIYEDQKAVLDLFLSEE